MAEPQAPYGPDRAEVTIRRTEPPANGASAVAVTDRPDGLIGVAIPSRNRSVRRRVLALYQVCEWLTAADVSAATRWAVLGEKFRRLAEVLDRLPAEAAVVKISSADLEPRKALGELRALSGEMTKLEAALGITATARAGLGVDLNRMRTLDAAAEVQRLRRIQQGRGGPSSPSSVPASSEGDDGG